MVAVYRQDSVRELRVPARRAAAAFGRNNRKVVTSVKGSSERCWRQIKKKKKKNVKMTNEAESLPQRFGIQPGHMSCAGQHVLHS